MKVPLCLAIFLALYFGNNFYNAELVHSGDCQCKQDQETFGGDQNVQFDGKDKIVAELESINQKIDRLMK